MARATRPTIADILASVDFDPERARAELEVERASARPRRTLIDQLVVIAHQEQPAEQLSLTDAVATGDRRKALEALRAHLAERLEDPKARCVGCGGFVPLSVPTAAVAKELRAVIDEMAKLVPPKESKVDEISERREARLRSAAVPVHPAGGHPGGS